MGARTCPTDRHSSKPSAEHKREFILARWASACRRTVREKRPPLSISHALTAGRTVPKAEQTTRRLPRDTAPPPAGLVHKSAVCFPFAASTAVASGLRRATPVAVTAWSRKCCLVLPSPSQANGMSGDSTIPPAWGYATGTPRNTVATPFTITPGTLAAVQAFDPALLLLTPRAMGLVPTSAPRGCGGGDFGGWAAVVASPAASCGLHTASGGQHACDEHSGQPRRPAPGLSWASASAGNGDGGTAGTTSASGFLSPLMDFGALDGDLWGLIKDIDVLGAAAGGATPAADGQAATLRGRGTTGECNDSSRAFVVAGSVSPSEVGAPTAPSTAALSKSHHGMETQPVGGSAAAAGPLPAPDADADGGPVLHGDRESRGGLPAATTRRTRKPLTQHAVRVLKSWMFMPEHFDHPYPSDSEKAALAAATGLTVKQVKRDLTRHVSLAVFITRRRRTAPTP